MTPFVAGGLAVATAGLGFGLLRPDGDNNPGTLPTPGTSAPFNPEAPIDVRQEGLRVLGLCNDIMVDSEVRKAVQTTLAGDIASTVECWWADESYPHVVASFSDENSNELVMTVTAPQSSEWRSNPGQERIEIPGAPEAYGSTIAPNHAWVIIAKENPNTVITLSYKPDAGLASATLQDVENVYHTAGVIATNHF